VKTKYLLPISVFAACWVSAGCGSGSAPETATPASDANEPKLVQVNGQEAVQLDPESVRLAGIKTAPAGSSGMNATMQPTGEVSATDTGAVQITPRLPGKITQVLVNVGDRVTPGQTIAWVDSVDLATAQAAYETAVAHANLSKNQLAQQKKLAGYGALSAQAVEDARSAASAADAAVQSDMDQIKVDQLALTNTQSLVKMGEITRKPLEDAQNSYSDAQSTASQAASTLHSTKSNYDRAVILYKGGVYARQQLEDAETAYNSAVASDQQAKTAERLSREELTRQEKIFNSNLNGAQSLVEAESKVQQDRHTYQNDVVSQGLAHTQYQRALAVNKSGIPVSQALQSAQDTYDEAMVAVQAAASTLKLYGVQPGKSGAVVPIVSPIKGIVSARTMVVGQNVDTSTQLARLINLDQVYIDAQVYENDLGGVAVGDKVSVSVSALPTRTFTGKVQWIANELNPDTRTTTVRTMLANSDWLLRPGMFATVKIGARKSMAGVAIPADAVLQEGDDTVVYVQIAAGQYAKRKVKVGPAVDGRVPALSGISPGDLVVQDGNVLIQKAQSKLESGK